MATIDRMDWHYADNFPKNLPEENSGTHIGFYLTWIIQNDLIGEMHSEDSPDEIQTIKSREMTGREFLIDFCDGKFWDDDLNEEGLDFTLYYYTGKSTSTFKNYMDDYCHVLGKNNDSIYAVDNSWENYDKIKPVLDERFAEWKRVKENKG